MSDTITRVRTWCTIVSYGDDTLRRYLVWAETEGEARHLTTEHARGLLGVSATPTLVVDEIEYDGLINEPGERRLALKRAVVVWWPGDEEHKPGFVVNAELSDGSRVFPMGHPQSFENESEAWGIAHLLRFDNENGMCWMASASQTA